MFSLSCGDDAPLRREVAELGARSQAGLPVGHRVHQSQSRQPVQMVPQGRLRNPSKAGHLLHGGYGRGAQQPQGVLLALGQPVVGGAAFLPVSQGVVQLPQQLSLAPDVGDQFFGGGVNGLEVVAHGAGDGAGQRAAQVSPFQEAPEGVPGDAETQGGLGLAMPQDVGPHVHSGQDAQPPLQLLPLFSGVRR